MAKRKQKVELEITSNDNKELIENKENKESTEIKENTDNKNDKKTTKKENVKETDYIITKKSEGVYIRKLRRL